MAGMVLNGFRRCLFQNHTKSIENCCTRYIIFFRQKTTENALISLLLEFKGEQTLYIVFVSWHLQLHHRRLALEMFPLVIRLVLLYGGKYYYKIKYYFYVRRLCSILTKMLLIETGLHTLKSKFPTGFNLLFRSFTEMIGSLFLTSSKIFIVMHVRI